MIRLLLAMLIAISTLVFTACPGQQKDRPPSPTVLTAISNYELDKLSSDEASYAQAVSVGDWDKATQIRNASIYHIKKNVDWLYFNFEADLFAKRASNNVLFDITELAGSAIIGGMSNGARMKSYIGTALTALKGGRKSIDDNFFRSQSMDAIVSKMNAGRTRVWTRITQNLNGFSAQTYSLDEAQGDTIEYFFAGSLTRALQEIAQQAGADAIQAKAEAAAVQEIRLASDAEFDNSKKIRGGITALVRALRGTDAQASADARATIKSALVAEGVAVADNITDDDLVKALVARSVAINRSPNREADQKRFLVDLKIQ